MYFYVCHAKLSIQTPTVCVYGLRSHAGRRTCDKWTSPHIHAAIIFRNKTLVALNAHMRAIP